MERALCVHCRALGSSIGLYPLVIIYPGQLQQPKMSPCIAEYFLETKLLALKNHCGSLTLIYEETEAWNDLIKTEELVLILHFQLSRSQLWWFLPHEEFLVSFCLLLELIKVCKKKSNVWCYKHFLCLRGADVILDSPSYNIVYKWGLLPPGSSEYS